MRFPNEQSLPGAASAAVWPVSGGTEGGEATAPHCGSPEPARSTSGRWWPATPAHSPQLHGQTRKGQGDAASGTTLHTSHFAPVLSSQGRVSQVRPRPAGPPRSRITWAAQATVRPALPVPPWPCPSLGPPQRRPPPGPGPVPSLLGRAQPCPPLAQSLREDGGPVTGWCRRGSEHGARREAAPSVAEDGPLTCQPPAPPDRPPAGSSPQPRCPATAQNTRGRPRRETARRGGTVGPGRRQQRRGGAGSAAAAADPSPFGPENVSTSRLQIPNAPSRSHENTQIPLPGPCGSPTPARPRALPRRPYPPGPPTGVWRPGERRVMAALRGDWLRALESALLLPPASPRAPISRHL